MKERAFGWALILGLALANGWAWRDNLSLGFTDTDALADLAAARADGLSGWLNQLQLPLTAGVGGDNANFYRPVTMLHYALIRALFGHEPLGWQLWDLGLHGLNTLLLLGLLRAMGGGLGASAFVGFLFSLHPLAVEVVPAVARNLDALMTAFSLGCVWAALAGRKGLAVFLGMMALGSKETAIILPVVVAGLWGREGARALGVWGLLIGLFLAQRTQVLSGLGGYHEADQTLDWLGAFTGPLKGVWESFLPGWSAPLNRGLPEGARWPLSVLALFLLLLGFGPKLKQKDPRVWVGLALWLLPLMLYGFTGTYTRRLMYLPTAGLVLALSALATPGARVLLGGMLLSMLPASPLVHRYTDWAMNDQVTRSLTTGVQDKLAALPKGSVVWVIDRCIWLNAEPKRERIWKKGLTLNNCVAVYSLQAWVDDVLGPGHIQLRALTATQPRGPVPSPRWTQAPGLLELQGPLMSRSLTRGAKDLGFVASAEGERWTLSVPPAVLGDYALIAGGEAGALLELR